MCLTCKWSYHLISSSSSEQPGNILSKSVTSINTDMWKWWCLQDGQFLYPFYMKWYDVLQNGWMTSSEVLNQHLLCHVGYFISSFVQVCSDSLGLKKIDTLSKPDCHKSDIPSSRLHGHIIGLRKMCTNEHNEVCTLKPEHYSAMFQTNVFTEFREQFHKLSGELSSTEGAPLS